MPIQIIKEDLQSHSEIADGRIAVSKPLGFPQDKGRLKPYSNLFYFGVYSSDYEATIHEARNQGFEILTYVIRGSIESFDGNSKQWTRLGPNDLQVIHSGSGFTHAKKLDRNTQFIQIWLDPNLRESLQMDGRARNYDSKLFVESEHERYKEAVIIGEKTLVKVKAESFGMRDITFFPGNHAIPIRETYFYTAYIIKGDAEISTKIVEQDDFFILYQESKLIVSNSRDTRILLIENPNALTHQSYYEINKEKYK